MSSSRAVFACLFLLSSTALAAPAGKRVAVLSLSAKAGFDQGTSDLITQVLESEIRSLGNEVVGQADINTMLGFEKLKDAVSCQDSSCLADIGGALGVQEIVHGAIGELGSSLVLTVKRMSVSPPKVLGQVVRQISAAKKESLVAELHSIAKELYGDQSGRGSAAAADQAAPIVQARAGQFRARLGLGGGGLTDDFHGPFGLVSASATGGSVAGQLDLGWTINRKWALGAAFVSESVQSPKIVNKALNVSSDVSVGTLTYLGAFVEMSLSPEARSGWQFFGSLGGSRLTIEDSTHTIAAHQPVGGGAVLLAGYEWRVGSSFALGLLARATGAVMSDQAITHTVGALSALATIAYR